MCYGANLDKATLFRNALYYCKRGATLCVCVCECRAKMETGSVGASSCEMRHKSGEFGEWRDGGKKLPKCKCRNIAKYYTLYVRRCIVACIYEYVYVLGYVCVLWGAMYVLARFPSKLNSPATKHNKRVKARAKALHHSAPIVWTSSVAWKFSFNFISLW